METAGLYPQALPVLRGSSLLLTGRVERLGQAVQVCGWPAMRNGRTPTVSTSNRRAERVGGRDMTLCPLVGRDAWGLSTRCVTRGPDLVAGNGELGPGWFHPYTFSSRLKQKGLHRRQHGANRGPTNLNQAGPDDGGPGSEPAVSTGGPGDPQRRPW
jgi:hypothetical protein